MLTTMIEVFTSLLIILPPLVMFGLSLRLLFDYEDFNFDWLYRKIFPTGRKASTFSFSLGGLMLVISLVWSVAFFRSHFSDLLDPYLNPTQPAVVEESAAPAGEAEPTAEESEPGPLPEAPLAPAPAETPVPVTLPETEGTHDH